MIPIDFQVSCSKVKVKPLITFDPFTWSISKLVQGLPKWLDDSYWFSGHIFKGQGKATLPSPLCCPLNNFWPFTSSIPILVQGMSKWLDDPFWFQVTCSKVKVKPLFLAHFFVRSISFYPFTWSIPNLVQGLLSMSRWFLLIFRSHVKRSRSNHSSQITVFSAQYLLTHSLDQYQTWCRVCLND